MKYRDYTATDFAGDSFFIRWVKNPDEESDWFWMSFIGENPDCKPVIDEARELISVFDFPVHALDTEEVSSIRHNLLMQMRMEKEAEKDNAAAGPSVHRVTWRQWLRAASILIIPLIGIGLYFLMNPPGNFATSLKAGSPEAIKETVNQMGEKSVLFLSDGTKIWVNGSSKISYGKDFDGHDTRDVFLEGEAFFEVAHNPEKPFIVHTSSIRIKVLGTAFNVKSYSQENTIEATLVRGKIRIEQSDVMGNRIGDVELKPNQSAVFNKASRIINIKEEVDVAPPSWRKEKLIFDEESIEHVLQQMEQWYNVKINVSDDANLECKLTASIEKETLEEVLTLLAVSHGIVFEISGGEVFITGQICEQNNP